MSSIDYLNALAARGVELWIEGAKLQYKAPKEVATPELLAELKANKTALLELLEQFSGSAGTYPLSHSQRSLWSLHRLQPDSAAYNVTYACTLVDDLDLGALARCVDCLIARHPILRTRYAVEEGQPVQQVGRTPSARLAVERTFGATETAIRDWIEQEANRPFDLGVSPIRLKLLVNEPATPTPAADGLRHVLLLNVHHVAADFWSLEILVRELRTLYGLALRGEPLKLPPLRLQYADCVQQELDRLQGEEGRALAAFWDRELAGGLPALALATDRVRPAVKTENGRVLTASLGADLTRRVKEAAKGLRVTPYMLMLSVYQLFLYLHTGQSRLAVGAPTAGRGTPGSETVLGHFVNTLVVVAEAAPDLAFDALLDGTRATMLRILDHADYPFPLLVERLRPPRDPSRSPLYQVMFNWNQRRAEGAAEAAGARLFERTLVASSTGTRGATHDLTLNVQDADDGYDAAWTYNSDLFEQASIAAFARQYRGLIEQVLADPRRALAAYSLADARERSALLLSLAQRLRRAEPGATLPAAVAARAAEAPSHVAWRLGETPVTNEAVATAVTRLAGQLRAAGIGPDSRVALRHIGAAELAVALIALMSVDATVLIEDDAQDGTTTGPADADALLAGGGDRALPRWCPEAIRIVALARARAPLGDPAALAAPARLEGFCQGAADALGLHAGANAVLLDGTPVKLAAALLVGAVACGATVLMPHAPTLAALCDDEPAAAQHAAQALQATLAAAARRPTSALLPAALLPRLGAALASHAGPCVAYGDRPHLLQRHAAAHALPCRFVSDHGVDRWVGPVVFEASAGDGWCLLEPRGGYPIAVSLGPTGDVAAAAQAARLHLIVDRAAADVVGPGAIDARLARHRHQPDVLGALALQTVVELPFTVVRRTDGSLQAQDARGHSASHRASPVPLGVIESAVAGLPGVAEAIVDVRTVDGVATIVAWVRDEAGAPAGRGDEAASTWPERRERELQRALKAHLPESLQADAVVLVDRLPLAANGAVAHDRLPAPRTRAESARAAAGAVQASLVQIWREVLGLTDVGVDDDFFALGGDSIQAAVIVSRAATQHLYFEPKDLFENPTIATLAEVASHAPRIEAPQDAITGDFEPAPAAGWFFDRVKIDLSHFNQALLLGVLETPDAAAMQETLRRIACRHDVLRSRFVPTDGHWVQRFDDEASAVAPSWAIVDTRDAAGRLDEPRWQAAIAQAQSSLDIERGPLWAVRWLVGPSLAESRLLIVAHHLVIDGVSWSILLQDLGETYMRLRAGLADRATLKTSSAPAWVARWADHARAGGLAPDRAYWLSFAGRVDQALSERGPIALMKHRSGRRDDATPSATPQSVGLSRASLGRELTAAFRTQAHQAYGTDANDLFAAALHAGFRAWGGSEGLLLDMEIHGRDTLAHGADLGRTVGWFTAIFPVLLEAPALEDGAGALVKHVKEHLRAIPAKGAGFGALRHLASAGDAATRQRLAQLPDSPVLFTYLGALDQIAGGSALLSGAVEPAPGIRSPHQRSTHLLDLCAYIVDGCLTLEGRHPGGEAVEESIGALMQHVVQALEAIVRHCCAAEAGGLTPSDVPELGLGQDELDSLLDELAALDG